MIEKQNIDRLFQEKFKDFESQPSPKVWKGIEARLKEDKKDRKVIPFWFRFAGIAAALLIGLLITDNIGNAPKDNNPANSVVLEQNPSVDGSKTKTNNSGSEGVNTFDRQNNGEQNKDLQPVGVDGFENGIASGSANPENGTNSSAPNAGSGKGNNLDNQNANDSQNNLKRKNQYINPTVNKGVASSEKRKGKKTSSTEKAEANASENSLAIRSKDNKLNATLADPNKATVANGLNGGSKSETQNNTTDDTKTINAPEEKLLNENKIIAAVTGDDTQTDTTAIATVVPNTLEELLKEKEKKTVTTNEPKVNRWQISTNVAPIYFSSTSNKSPIDARLAESSKEYKADLTYGIGVRYALNKKFTVRAGVNTVGMEYTTNELAFVQTTNARALQNVKPNIQGTMIHIVAKAGTATALAPEPADNGRKFSSSLSQRTGYIEVPLEMSYKLVDRKFAIELIGGISTLFLNENSVSLIASGIEMEIGKANNLNDMHFSTNFGVGLRYNFLRNFQFNVEPMFKYQINTFSHSSNYNPYMFGLYTGINYRF